MPGLLDYLGLGSGMPGLLAQQAGIGDPMLNPPPPPPPAPLPGQPGYLPPFQGRGLPTGATPFPTGPDPDVAPGQPSGGLLAPGYGGGPRGVPPALLEDKPPGAAGSPGAAAPTPSAVPPNLLARLGGFLQAHSNQLMGLGAGIAGGRSLGEGVSKGLTGAMAGQQQDLGLASTNATYQALVDKGVPPQQAMSAIGNPEVLKTLLAKHFSIPEFKMITNPVTGQSQLVLTDAAAGTAQSPTALPAGRSGTYRGRQAVFQNGQWYYTD